MVYVTPVADPHFPFPNGLPPASAGGTSGKTFRAISARFRLDDLMRWRVAGTLKGVEGRGRGAYLGKRPVCFI